MRSKCLRAALSVAGLSIAGAVLLGPAAHADGNNGARPLTAENFFLSAPRGFGDPNNTWPQAMTWWHNHLYVGTARQSLCSSLFAVWNGIRLIQGIDRTFVDSFFPYPPHDPDLSCAPDGADLSLQAEIWQWT